MFCGGVFRACRGGIFGRGSRVRGRLGGGGNGSGVCSSGMIRRHVVCGGVIRRGMIKVCLIVRRIVNSGAFRREHPRAVRQGHCPLSGTPLVVRADLRRASRARVFSGAAPVLVAGFAHIVLANAPHASPVGAVPGTLWFLRASVAARPLPRPSRIPIPHPRRTVSLVVTGPPRQNECPLSTRQPGDRINFPSKSGFPLDLLPSRALYIGCIARTVSREGFVRAVCASRGSGG